MVVKAGENIRRGTFIHDCWVSMSSGTATKEINMKVLQEAE